jgi:hypothetical protein
VARMLQRDPQRMYLTHFGPVGDVPHLAGSLLAQVREMVRVGSALRDAPHRHEALKQAFGDLYVAQATAHGSPLSPAAMRELLVLDIELNAQGFGVWLDRQAKAKA